MLARLRACAYMCRFVNCRCVWVAFCVEWASLFRLSRAQLQWYETDVHASPCVFLCVRLRRVGRRG